MAEDDLEPVQGNPFETDLEPVDGDPFARPPGAMIDRHQHGTAIMEALSRVGADIKEGFGSEQLGFSPESEQELRRIGIFHDPETGRAGPIRFMNEAVIKPAAAAADAILRSISAGVYGLGGIVREMSTDAGLSQGQAERGRAETINFLNWAMQRGDMNIGHMSRPGPNSPAIDVKVGALPRPEDFSNAATTISGGEPSAALNSKLNRLYLERGLHPAEVANDAITSPRLRQDLLADHDALPEPYANLSSADGLRSENVVSDIDLLSHRDLSPSRVQQTSRGAIATRIMPDGRVVPAPEAVADYIKDFGREAGFKIAIGPAEPRGFTENGPAFMREFVRDMNTGDVKAYRQVYMPDTADELNRRWYGLGTAEIIYHEVGHALDYTVLRGDFKGGNNTPIDPAIKTEITEVSKRFRPKLWERDPSYNGTDAELMADAVASYLSNPTERARMPLFAEKYGAKLDKYVGMANKYLPKKMPDGWVPPETEAGFGGGGAGSGGGGGGGGGGFSMGDEPLEHTPRMIEGPRMTPEEARQSLLDHISVDNNVDTSKKLTWSRLYTNFVDKFHPIANAVKEAMNGETLSAADDPYKLARLFAGWSGKATHMLEKGTVAFDELNTNKTLGPGLKQVLEPVQDDLNGFRAFVAAARAKELELRGITTGFDPRAVNGYVTAENIKKYAPVMEKLVNYQNQVAAYLRDSGVLSREMYDAMLQANRLFVPFHVAIDHANIGIEQVGKELQARNPVKKIKGSDAPKIDPLESVVKNTYLMVAMAEKNVVASKLVDLVTGKNAAAEKQLKIEGPRPKTGTEVGEYLGELGMDEAHAADLQTMLNDMAARDRDGEVSRYVDGKRETYRINSDLANAMKGLNSETIGLIEKLMKPLTSTLRAGAVLTPDFMIRHTFRDSIYAFVTTSKGIFTPIDTARGMAGIIKEAPATQRFMDTIRAWTGFTMRDPDFWNWQLSGGGNTSMVHLDRNYLQEDLHRLTKETGIMTRAWNVVVDPKSSFVDKAGAVLGTPFKVAGRYFIHPLQVGTELVTSATHLGAFKKSIRYFDGEGGPSKENILEAGWVSRHTAVDAARIGAQMRGYNMISAFANIKIQDTDRILRLLKDDPVQGGLLIAAGITLPSMLLWYANKDDSRYQELPEWEKDVFWHVITNKWEDATPEQAQARMAAGADQVRKVGDNQWQVNNGHIFRLPKPFAAGVVFGSGPERLADMFYHSKKAGEAFKGFFGSLTETTVGQILPNAIQPMIDQAQNRVTFTGRTLIPAASEKLLPEYQYTEYTTETAKALGKIVSEFPGMTSRADRSSSMIGGAERALSSPILIENYVRGWSGGLGMYALNAADKGLRMAGLVPDPPKAIGTLADEPIIRAFISRYPSATTQSIQDFFDKYDEQKTFFDTWKSRAAAGDAEATARIERLGGQGIFLQLEGIKQALTSQSQVIHDVNKNPTITPAEKRQLIDGLYYGMIAIGKQGTSQLRQIDDVLQGRQEP